MIAGNEHYMSLYREYVPVLLKAVAESYRRNLRSASRLSAYNVNIEEKQLSKSIELL
jgi:hypothetical protein